LTLAETHIEIAVDLLEAPPQLIDPVDRVLHPAGELAHLRLKPIHPQLSVDGRARNRVGDWGWAATVDLALQHAEIPL
jgi:hypothetical protein